MLPHLYTQGSMVQQHNIRHSMHTDESWFNKLWYFFCNTSWHMILAAKLGHMCGCGEDTAMHINFDRVLEAISTSQSNALV